MKIITKEDYNSFIENLVNNAPKMSPNELQRKQSICCSNYIFLGYSVPEDRLLAKQILKDGYQGLFDYGTNEYYEEVLIKGFILSGIRDKNIMLENLLKYIPLIDSWSICDSFITSFYCYKKQTTRQDFEMFSNYANSEKEFYARFGLMMIFRYCLKEEYLEEIFILIKQIKNHKYYVNMAISWLICECMVKYPAKTYPLIQEKAFIKFIQNKAISKCHDSFRISDEVKSELKKYRI